MDAGGPAPASIAVRRHRALRRRQLQYQTTGAGIVFLLEQVVNGLVLGGYYLLIALGLSLIFSVGGVVNLAHGAFYALGAYISIEIAKFLGFGPAVVLSPVAVGLLGILFERFLLRRFYTADPILSLLVTFGLAMVVEQMIRIIWGASPIPVSMPQAMKGAVIVGDFLFSRYRLFLLGVVVIVLASIWLLLHKASFGRVIRAGIQKPDMVAALGIRLQPYMTAIVMLGVGIAGLAGALFAPITIVHPAMGADVITVAFVVVVIGGLGSFWGVVISALLVGVVRGVTINFVPAAGEASMYVLMFLVLLFRPRGLLGERIEKFET
jgi:branched-chain amino acid transport system permease protein